MTVVVGDTSIAVVLALFVTITFSGAFFYMMRWAASSSERQQSRFRRVSVGDGFIATKHKKPAPAVVHQRKKNGKNVAARPAVSSDNDDTVGANDRNGDSSTGNKKKTVDNDSVLTDDVIDIPPSVCNRRSRRQRTQELLLQPADASTPTIPVNNHLSSSVDDEQEDNEGEWITMTSGCNNSVTTAVNNNSGSGSVRRKVVENKIEQRRPQVDKQQKREKQQQQAIKHDPLTTTVGVTVADAITPTKGITIATKSSQSRNSDKKPTAVQEHNVTSQYNEVIENCLRVKVEDLRAELKTLQTEYETTTKALREDNENTRAKHDAVVERLRAAENKIATLKQKRADQETAMKTLNLESENLRLTGILNEQSNQKSIFEKMKVEHEAAILSLRKENELLHENHEIALNKQRINNETAIQELRNLAIELSDKYQLEMKDLCANYESRLKQICEENRNLLTEHSKTIEMLRHEHQSMMVSEAERLSKEYTAATKCLLVQHQTEIEQLKLQLVQLQQNSQIQPNNHRDDEANAQAASDINSSLLTQNKNLQHTVSAYKQIIADTEQMLNQLYEHIEQEDSHWSKRAADLQQELDETRRQLEDNISQQSRQ